MRDPLAPVGDGHTEVPAEAQEQLVPTYIATLGELHEAEAENIAKGSFGLRPTLDTCSAASSHHGIAQPRMDTD